MSESHKCQRCKKQFEVTDRDFEYLKKISPILAGKTYIIDPPEHCFDCRMTTLMAWRNERNLHRLKCTSCSRDIVSVFSAESNFNVYCSDCFWSDKIDATESGRDFDFDRSFFEQFGNLMKRAKLLTLYAVNNENCEYVNQESDDDNCYLCVGGYSNKDSYYCTYSSYSEKCINCLGVTNCTNLANCTFAISCYGGQFLYDCNNCRDCYFCQNCIGCDNCFGSMNLRYKKYYFFNEQLPKDEYFKKISEYLDTVEGIEKANSRFEQHRLNYPYKYDIRVFCGENCNGDLIFQCKNVENVFYSANCEDCKNSYLVNKITGAVDSLAVGRGELVYYSGSSISLYSSAFCTSSYSSRNCYYCFMCYNSNDLFGCIGLNHKQYCIFNKQYSKNEYEELLPRIIKHMQERGEWGQFFPIELSPFVYNESMAIEYYPKTKNEAQEIKANWREVKDDEYKGDYYQPKDISSYQIQKNPDAEKEIDKCLAGVIKCQESGRPFKIIARELAQYIERNIQLPRQHPIIRYRHRLELLNKIKLYQRKCMCNENSHGHSEECKFEFKTTFDPSRKERIYCEDCYQKAINQ